MIPFARIAIPAEAEVFEIAQTAAASRLRLISNGVRAALSPVVPDGWTEIRVRNLPPAGQSRTEAAR